MWNVLVFASLLDSGSFFVDVLLSGTGLVAASGTIFSATLEMGSREWTSLTEAKPREKTAGRMAAKACALARLNYRMDDVCVPARVVARREKARVQAIARTVGVESDCVRACVRSWRFKVLRSSRLSFPRYGTCTDVFRPSCPITVTSLSETHSGDLGRHHLRALDVNIRPRHLSSKADDQEPSASFQNTATNVVCLSVQRHLRHDDMET